MILTRHLPVNIYFKLQIEPPDSVIELSASSVSSRTASISWRPPYDGNNPISLYTIEWQQIGDVNPKQQQQQQHHSHQSVSSLVDTKQSLSVQQPGVTLTQLQPLCSYEIRVRAHNSLGSSSIDSATPLYITTSDEPPAYPPTGLVVAPVSSSSLRVSWRPAANLRLPPDLPLQSQLPTSQHTSDQHRNNKIPAAVRGYYLGYKISNSSDVLMYKTVTNEELASMSRQQSSAAVANSSLHDTNQKELVSALLDGLQRSTKYSIVVQAFNSAGAGPQSDSIEAQTLADDPPPQPQLRVGLVTFASIELLASFDFKPELNQNRAAIEKQFFDQEDHKQNLLIDKTQISATIDKIKIFYKSLNPIHDNINVNEDAANVMNMNDLSSWNEKILSPVSHKIVSTYNTDQTKLEFAIIDKLKSSDRLDVQNNQIDVKDFNWTKNISLDTRKLVLSFVLDKLDCGTHYQIYMRAYNSIGPGLSSSILRTKTRGSAPIAPTKSNFLNINSTFVQLNFESWLDNGCQLNYFVINYKQLQQSPMLYNSISDLTGRNNNEQWIRVSDKVSGSQSSMQISNLTPETWYTIHIVASSSAGKTSALFTFMTLDKFGIMTRQAIEFEVAEPTTAAATTSINPSLRALSTIQSILSFFSIKNQSSNPFLTFSAAVASIVLFLLTVLCSISLLNSTNKDQKQTNNNQGNSSNILNSKSSKKFVDSDSLLTNSQTSTIATNLTRTNLPVHQMNNTNMSNPQNNTSYSINVASVPVQQLYSSTSPNSYVPSDPSSSNNNNSNKAGHYQSQSTYANSDQFSTTTTATTTNNYNTTTPLQSHYSHLNSRDIAPDSLCKRHHCNFNSATLGHIRQKDRQLDDFANQTSCNILNDPEVLALATPLRCNTLCHLRQHQQNQYNQMAGVRVKRDSFLEQEEELIDDFQNSTKINNYDMQHQEQQEQKSHYDQQQTYSKLCNLQAKINHNESDDLLAQLQHIDSLIRGNQLVENNCNINDNQGNIHSFYL